MLRTILSRMMRSKGGRAVVVCGCLLLVAGAVVLGQSGRKQKKSEPLPPVQGVPESKTKDAPPETEPEAPPEKKPELKQRVVIASDTGSFDVSIISMNVARQACVDELRREAGRDANVQDGGSMTRSDAMKAAKGDDHSYFVLLEARTMAMSSGQPELNYVIFAPKSGKISGTGIGMPVQYNSRVPRPPIAMSRYDYAWELCGRDVAHQLIGRLKLGEPSRP